MANGYELKISIKGAKPPIWRKIIVPGDITFYQLHELFQLVMGWQNYHLYQFEFKDSNELIVDEIDEDLMGDTDRKEIEAKETMLDTYLVGKNKFAYIYDFGDWWEHTVEIVREIEDEFVYYPSIVSSKGACPPEDCGGIHGYDRLQEILADPTNSEYAEMKEWSDGQRKWKMTNEEVNEALEAIIDETDEDWRLDDEINDDLLTQAEMFKRLDNVFDYDQIEAISRASEPEADEIVHLFAVSQIARHIKHDLEKVEEMADKILAIDPQHYLTLINKAWVASLNQKNEEALAILKQVEEHPESEDNQQLVNEAFAVYYMEKGEYEKAITYFMKNLDDLDENVVSHSLVEIAKNYMFLFEFEKAEETLLKAVYDTRNEDTIFEYEVYQLLMANAHNARKFEKAITYADRVIAIDDTDVDAYRIRAESFVVLAEERTTTVKLYQKPLNDYTKVIVLEAIEGEKNPYSYLARAKVYLSMGKAKKARVDLDIALDLTPDDELIRVYHAITRAYLATTIEEKEALEIIARQLSESMDELVVEEATSLLELTQFIKMMIDQTPPGVTPLTLETIQKKELEHEQIMGAKKIEKNKKKQMKKKKKALQKQNRKKKK